MNNCPFCNLNTKIIKETETMLSFYDQYPVTEGHVLIIPKRHISDYFSMSNKEKTELDQLINDLKKHLEVKYKNITGFNIGMNCGESAGQTIFHAHIHLIPRRDGDTKNPRGGVRGVIPEKMSY